MVAKSEASMPMSRALAKLAVAADLGTAARPSTAVPAFGSGAAGGGGGGGGGSGGGGVVAGKRGLPTAGGTGRPLLLKPSATRAVLAAMPLASLDNALSAPSRGPPPATSPTTPRLPPLSPNSAAAAGGSGATATAHAGTSGDAATAHLLPRPQPHQRGIPGFSGRAATTTAPAQPRSSPVGPSQPRPATQVQHHQPQSQPQAGSPGRLPLPLLPHTHPPAGGRAAAGGSSDFGQELLDAAKKHPGLPASLLAQLHRSRGRNGGGGLGAAAPSSAPCQTALYNGKTVAAAAAGAVNDRPPPTAHPPAAVRPLSPRSRAKATASMTAAAAVAAPAAAAPPQPPAHLPPPAALAGLSPAALEVLLGPAPSGPPPPSSGGLLVMRRTSSVVSSTGAPLRPSTAASQAAAAGSPGSAGRANSPSAPTKPHVVPHITVPYKPGSIRLPPGAVHGLTALDASGARPLTSASQLSGGGAKGGSGLQPFGHTDPARPWTSAGARPTTANPLTHSMALDHAAALVVHVPRPPTSGVSASPAPPPPGTAAGRAALLTAGGGGSVGRGDPHQAGQQPERKLTAEELRAVVAAVAAARPDAAALLLQRPSTAAAADAVSRPGTASGGGGGGLARRTGTASSLPEDLLRRLMTSGLSGTDLAAAMAAVAGTVRPGSSCTADPARPSSSLCGDGVRPSSRCSSRGGSSRGRTAAFDDAWPAPQSPRTAASSSGGTAEDAAGRQRAFTAWGSRRRPLQAIPEDAELEGGEEDVDAESLLGSSGLRTASGAALSLQPLEPLDPDPDLDAAWASIVAANLRPDTAALVASTGSIDVFSRPGTGSARFTRQAAPMVLVLEDITASTPEVLERELATLSLEELQSIKSKLGA